MAKPAQYFRAGVVIVVTDGKGHILALRRADRTEAAWQLPQGGLEADEDPEHGMWRELEEEAGLSRTTCEHVASSERWHTYELPKAYRSKKVGLGQAQRWFVCRLTADESAITPDGREFVEWKWTTADALLAEVVEFRRSAYAAAFAELAEAIG